MGASKEVLQKEDREALLSDSEADTLEWSPARFTGARGSKVSPIITALKDYWWIYTTGLLISIIGLQLAIWHDIRKSVSNSSSQVGGDYTNQGPVFSTEVVQWKADPSFTPLNATEFLDPKIQTQWETLYPAGFGFVGGDDSILTYNSTSVTHQLHCVYIMGKIFSAVLTKAANIPEAEDYEGHFLHCVDYMRQAAMCAGDVTLEPRGENGQPAPVTLENAFNGLHVCKSYNQVKSYLADQIRDGARNILPLDD